MISIWLTELSRLEYTVVPCRVECVGPFSPMNTAMMISNSLGPALGSPTNSFKLVIPVYHALHAFHSSGYPPQVAQIKLRIVESIFIS